MGQDPLSSRRNGKEGEHPTGSQMDHEAWEACFDSLSIHVFRRRLQRLRGPQIQRITGISVQTTGERTKKSGEPGESRGEETNGD